jgi:hypothetical protein
MSLNQFGSIFVCFFCFKVTKQEKKELNKSIVVKVGEIDRKTIRLLTHLDVDSDEIELALLKIRFVANEYTTLDRNNNSSEI